MLFRLLLVLLYPLLLLRRLRLLFSGRDPMRSQEPSGSCWVPRDADPAAHTYYSESSAQVNDTVPAAALRRLSRAWTPTAGQRDAARQPSAEPADIPDEVYTLW